MPDLATIGIRVKDNLDTARQKLDRFRQSSEKTGDRVQRATNRINRGFNSTIRAATSLQGALAGIGTGVAITGIVKQFAQFEEQLTNVGKTADLDGERLDRLGRRIQEIGQEVPVSTSRLLNLAGAAGQLGVKGTDDIAKFASTLGKLETATDLAGEEGARSLARLLNITGQSVSEIDRLGSSITALGNNFATTEQEITQTSTFLGSATQQFDLTAQQVIGLSGALRALGQNAETSGSAVGAALDELNLAIANGGDRLQRLVDLTGKSAQELQKQFGENAVSVLLDFGKALGSLPAAQQTKLLDQFNLAGRETRRVIGTLASNTDLVSRALNTANSEWERNTALNREAARATDTFNAQMQLVRNEISRAATIAGRELAPVILRLSKRLANFLEEASDSGRLERFFRTAANSAETLLNKLESIVRVIGALKGTAAGASTGAAIGSVIPGVGTLIGGGIGAVIGGGAGAFSPEIVEGLASSVLELGENSRKAGQKMQSAGMNARNLRVELGKQMELLNGSSSAFGNYTGSADQGSRASSQFNRTLDFSTRLLSQQEKEAQDSSVSMGEFNRTLDFSTRLLGSVSGEQNENIRTTEAQNRSFNSLAGTLRKNLGQALGESLPQSLNTAKESMSSAADQIIRDATAGYNAIRRLATANTDAGVVPGGEGTGSLSTSSLREQARRNLDIPLNTGVISEARASRIEQAIQEEMRRLQRRATGGPVRAGQAYIVGENGPEIFQPRQSGQVVSNENSFGGSVNVTVDARGSSDPQAVAEQTAEAVAGVINRNGRRGRPMLEQTTINRRHQRT